MPPFFEDTMSTYTPYYGGEASQTFPLLPTPGMHPTSMVTTEATELDANQRAAVSITLTPLSKSEDRRHITLYANRPVTIGRSSRSETKNLFPAEQNALFDCPVVSRKHAELEFKPNSWDESSKQVMLTDKQSMHGTSVNGHKLQRDVPFQLKTGDLIKFGNQVAHANGTCVNYCPKHQVFTDNAPDTHDGVVVSLRIIGTTTQDKLPVSATAKTTSGFRVPSESEYDSDGADSIDGQAQDQVSTPEQNNAAPGSRQSPIDLDGDKPTGSLCEIIDLDPPASAQRPFARPLPRTIVPDSLDPFIVNPLPSLTGQPVNAAFQPRTSQTAPDVDNDSVMHHNTGLNAILQAGTRGDSQGVDRSRRPLAQTAEHHDDDSEDENAIGDEIDAFYKDMSESDEEDDEDQLSDSDASDLADDASEESLHSDEGPEEQPIKRPISPELGSFGTFGQPATNAPTRPRPYDVFQEPLTGFWDSPADMDDSSRWDVGPDGLKSTSNVTDPPSNTLASFGSKTPFKHHNPLSAFGYAVAPVLPTMETIRPNHGISFSQPEGAAHVPRRFDPEPIAQKTDAAMSRPEKPAKMSIMNLVENRKNEIEQRIAPQLTVSVSATNNTNKRKADEISADVEETLPEVAAPGPRTSAPVITSERPVKKARFQRAAAEAGKYAFGMALGGVGTIAFLCSPLAERLLA